MGVKIGPFNICYFNIVMNFKRIFDGLYRKRILSFIFQKIK